MQGIDSCCCGDKRAGDQRVSHPFWSGPARLAFAELKRVLEDVDPGGHLELVVVDTDGCPNLYDGVKEGSIKLEDTGKCFEVRSCGIRLRPLSHTLPKSLPVGPGGPGAGRIEPS